MVLEGLGTYGLPHLTLDMPLSGDGVGGVGHSWPPTPHMHSLHSLRIRMVHGVWQFGGGAAVFVLVLCT